MSKRKNTKNKVGQDKLRNLINSKYGEKFAFNLNEEDPTSVPYWIPTGSSVLDRSIVKGQVGGLPGGKICSYAGEEGAGKSYMAVLAVANAQKMGIDCIYFDAESALDRVFLESMGVDVDSLIYIQEPTVNMVLDSIDLFCKNNDNRMLFVWDSLAATPMDSENEAEFELNNGAMSEKPRLLSQLHTRLSKPIAKTESTLLILNQLRTYIPKPGEWGAPQWFTPGGKAPKYAYSLEIWLNNRKSKAGAVFNENGYKVGSEVKATIKKSRFGTEGRVAAYDILWGDDRMGVAEEESWISAAKSSPRFKSASGWYGILKEDGGDEFYGGKKINGVDNFVEALQTNDELRKAMLDLLTEELVVKFENKEGNAEDFYAVDEEVEDD